MKRIILFILLLLFYQQIFAGVTGKISGRITDKKTGEALPGVNIFLSGTSLGSATDLNGEYYIIQIPPGTYEVKISMIGFKDVTVKNVEVLIDLTTPLNRAMEEEVFEGEEVVIVAERPVIQKDLTSSTQFLTINQIERLPITQTKERSPAEPIYYISPRLGISFPVTDNSLLHFNYGDFMQMPPVNRMFEFTYWRPVYITEGIIKEKQRAEEEGREPGHTPSVSKWRSEAGNHIEYGAIEA